MMPTTLDTLISHLNQVLLPEQFTDYCPNGLQVAGKKNIKKLVTGVTACHALIQAAIKQNADAILVHHGYFWRGEDPCITGIKYQRLKLLLENNLSLIAYHLPLDAHPIYGNNKQLGDLLNIQITGSLTDINAKAHGLIGQLSSPMSGHDFSILINNKLHREPLHIPGTSKIINKVAWCTGAAQGYIEQAIQAGVDAYITGEISESTVHIARESGIHFFSAGHHATERYGAQSLGNYLASKYAIEHEFIDIDSPV